MPKITYDYNRNNAVHYAHRWAFTRNPAYYDYEKIGGDCTNFASQCIFAGSNVMNYEENGWFYISGNNKSPSWSGVSFLWNFLVGNKDGIGPFAEEAKIRDMLPGDIIQLLFDGKTYQHSLLVVAAGAVPDAHNILVASHTDNVDNNPLSSYSYSRIRYLHIVGVRQWSKG